MNRGSLKTRFISEVDGDDSENLQKNCYVAFDFLDGHVLSFRLKVPDLANIDVF